jgi:predicted MFS family arabinose efflux permease
MRTRPALLYPVLYLALIPVAALMLETVFLQPQAVELGVPLAGIGVVAMAVQLTGVVGSAWSDRLRARFGGRTLVYAAPLLIIASLLLLAGLQVTPTLAFIAVIGFITAVIRPIVLAQIQSEVSDDVRATLLSFQSLIATFLGAVFQPTLGFVGDRAGLPSVYLVLAVVLGALTLLLFWRSRLHFPKYKTETKIARAGEAV